MPYYVRGLIYRVQRQYEEALDDLDIKKGDAVAAVVKATEVMVSKELWANKCRLN